MMKSNHLMGLLLLGLVLQGTMAGLTKFSLKDLKDFKVDSLTCKSPDYPMIRGAFLQWKEVMDLEKNGALSSDLAILQEIRMIAKTGMEQHDDIALIEATSTFSSLLQDKFDQLALVQSEHSIADSQCKQLKKQMEQLLTSDDADERRQCCAMLYGLVEYLVGQIENLQSQCKGGDTIININGNIERLDIIQNQCGCQNYPDECEEDLYECEEDEYCEEEQEKPKPKPKPKTIPPPPKTPVGPPPKNPTPPSVRPAKPTAEPTCVEGPKEVFDAAFNDKAIADAEVSGDHIKDASEYGYGFWFKFTMRHPESLYKGRTDPWYFVARLTNNKKYGDDGMGDRVLAVFQGQTDYSFSTNDVEKKDPNIHKEVSFNDIEGVWTHLFFSYDHKTNKAVAFFKFIGFDAHQLQFSVVHKVPSYLRFVLGGSDSDIYQGFNGQFSRPILKIGQGSFIGTPSQYNDFVLKCNPKPPLPCHELATIEYVKEPGSFVVDDRHPKPLISQYPLPEEYSVGGWFKWVPVEKQEAWHTIFRVTINNHDVNENDSLLGDRDLAAFVGSKGVLHFATYSYQDMGTNGDPNINQDIVHKDAINHWHYIYYGYSRPLRRAFAFVLMTTGRFEVDMTEVNHFLSHRHYLFLAKDHFYPSFNGQVAYFDFNLCDGAFDTEWQAPPRPPTPAPPIRIPTPKIPTPVPSEETTPLPQPEPPKPKPKVPTPKPKTIVPSESTPTPSPSSETFPPTTPSESTPTPHPPRTPTVPVGSEPTPSESTPSEPTSIKPEPTLIPEKPKTPIPLTVLPPEENKCVAGTEFVMDAAHNQGAVVNTEVTGKDLKDVSQYGYGFWMQFLSRHPSRLLRGKTEPWYFISRLTKNNPYGNLNMGDRTLAILQGKKYTFVTNDLKTDDANVIQSVGYDDIEGVWTYVYFSYSHVDKLAVGFLQYAGETAQRLQFSVTHEVPEYLRLVIGGNDLEEYPGFNGQFSKPILRIGRGSFINTLKNFEDYVSKCNPRPKLSCYRLGVKKVNSWAMQSFDERDKAIVETRSDFPLPEEYSVSGWFRWRQPTEQQDWHLVFRSTINTQDINENAGLLGDRELAVFVGKGSTGLLQFATYSYSDLVANGNPNSKQNMVLEGTLTRWSFIYFGYSRIERRAHGFNLVDGKVARVDFADTNHFLSSAHILYLAKDRFYPSYSGRAVSVSYAMCQGAFNPDYNPPTQPEYTPKPLTPPPVKPPTPKEPTPSEPTPSEPTPKEPTPKEPTPVVPKEPTPVVPKEPTPVVPKEPTPVVPKEPTPVKPKEPTPVVPKEPTPVKPKEPTPVKPKEPTPEKPKPKPKEFENSCVEGSKEIIDSSFKGDAVADIRVSDGDLTDSSEYGYGYWFRFLSRYPTELLMGKTEPHYFVSSLNKNHPFDVEDQENILGVLLSQGSYTVSTVDTETKNTNVHGNVEYKDIEGLWTYLYFSHSRKQNKVVALVTFEDGPVQKLEMKAVHDMPDFLRFVLGGADNKFPGFNGQFARPVLRIGQGAYLDSSATLNTFAKQCNPQPPKDCSKSEVLVLLKEKTEFKLDERKPEFIVTPENTKFADDYSVQGWFKWIQTDKKEPWHTMFRFTSNNPDINKNSQLLGDRSLTAQVGTQTEGVIALSTYSYTDLNGHGNPNLHQVVPHRNQLVTWHHVYFAYSRQERKALAFIDFGTGRIEVSFENVNHFLTERFYVYIAKDQFFESYSGKMSQVKVTLCNAYNPSFKPQPISPTPLPGEKIKTPVKTPTPKQPTPVKPVTPVEPEQPEICVGSVPYLEVTNKNIDEVIRILQEKKRQIRGGTYKEEDMCYCSFKSNSLAITSDLKESDVESIQIEELVFLQTNEQLRDNELLTNNRLRLRI